MVAKPFAGGVERRWPARSGRWRCRRRRRRRRRGRAASRPAPSPRRRRPRSRSTPRACSPLSNTASIGCGSRSGWNSAPSVPPAVRRPGVDEVRVVGEVRAGVDVVVAGGDDVVVARRPAASCQRRRRRRCGGHLGAAATASEPPSQKSFWTSTTISALLMATIGVVRQVSAGRSLVRQRSGWPARRATASARPTAASDDAGRRRSRDVVRAPAVHRPPLAAAHQRRPAAAGRASPGRRSRCGHDDLLDRRAGRLVRARTADLRPPCDSLCSRPLGDRPPVDLDELVDEAARSGAPQPVTSGGADAVAVDGRGGERGDRVLVEVAGDDDPGARRAEVVELLARPGGPARRGRRSRCGPRPAPGPATSTPQPTASRDVVGVDQQRGARCPATSTCARNAVALGVVQQREGVRRGARRRDAVAAGRPRGSRWLAKPARYAARAAATAASSWVRREPISMHGRPPAARRHPRGGRGDRRVVVVDREQQRLEHAPPRRRCPRRSAAGSTGSRARPRGSPRCRRRSGSRPASRASPSSTTPVAQAGERLVVEAERARSRRAPARRRPPRRSGGPSGSRRAKSSKTQRRSRRARRAARPASMVSS